MIHLNVTLPASDQPGALWWLAYRQVNGDRIAVDGGTARVRCDSRGHAESLRRVMCANGFAADDISIEEK